MRWRRRRRRQSSAVAGTATREQTQARSTPPACRRARGQQRPGQRQALPKLTTRLHQQIGSRRQQHLLPRQGRRQGQKQQEQQQRP